jgi:hypothetical protein
MCLSRESVVGATIRPPWRTAIRSGSRANTSPGYAAQTLCRAVLRSQTGAPSCRKCARSELASTRPMVFSLGSRCPSFGRSFFAFLADTAETSDHTPERRGVDTARENRGVSRTSRIFAGAPARPASLAPTMRFRANGWPGTRCVRGTDYVLRVWSARR